MASLCCARKKGGYLRWGDLFQVVRGDRVTSRLLFRFRDGSVDASLLLRMSRFDLRNRAGSG
jgi:hypothetical protein